MGEGRVEVSGSTELVDEVRRGPCEWRQTSSSD